MMSTSEQPLIPDGSHSGQTEEAWGAPNGRILHPLLTQYEVLNLIGSGGMGAVYRARQKSLRRLVAIKILARDAGDDEMRFGERFRHEALAMARLNHPGIVNVHDAGETPDGLLYFVMEHVEGRDLAHEIARRGRLPQAEVKAIAAQVCEALGYAHANGIVHRDIKPANILIDAQGRVKVADFGLAKLEEPMVSTLLTKSGTSMGTADFMAPETRKPGVMVDARADLYSLGVTIYQMLTGELPQGMFKLPSELLADVDPRWDEIICKALEPKPAERYQTASAMRDDLDALLFKAPEVSLAKTGNDQVKPPASKTRGTPRLGRLMIGLAIAAALGASVFLWIKKPLPAPATTGAEVWTDWLGPKLADAKNYQDGGWVREEGGLSTNREIAGTSISPLKIADGAVRVSYRLRDSGGMQITTRERGMGGPRELYLAHDTGESIYIARMNPGGKIQNLVDKAYPPEITREGEHTLEFRCVGSTLTATLNGILSVTTEDAALEEGAWAMVLKRRVLVKGVELLDMKMQQPANATAAATVLTATKEQPFVNSLSMKFVPVPIMGGPTDRQRVLFSIWETRVRDYEAFVSETKRQWLGPSQPPSRSLCWPQSNGAEPAIYVSWLDAKDFCEWLTQKERAAGLIGEDMAYRLPSDHEWSCASGLGSIEDPAKLPKDKHNKLTHIFPWGEEWPPPAGVGNFADEAAKAQGATYHVTSKGYYLDGYEDGYAYLAPVGTFLPTVLGLHDLAGNVHEYCEDWYDAAHTMRVTRNSHWGAPNRVSMVSSWRGQVAEDGRNHTSGIRVVLAPAVAASDAEVRHDMPTASTNAEELLATALKGLGVEWQDVSAEARVKAASLADLVVEKEVIRRRSVKGPSVRLPLTPPSWRNYAIRITHVGDAQIDLRCSEEGFYFVLGQAHQTIFRKQPGGISLGAALIPNQPHQPGFDINQPHELVAIVQGNHLRAWLDGRLVGDVRDNTYAKGIGAAMLVPQTQLQRVEIAELAGGLPAK